MKALLLLPVALCVLSWPMRSQIQASPSLQDGFQNAPPKAEFNPQDDKRPEGTSLEVLEVKPGPPVLKQKDLWNETGYLHPFVRMPKYILQDQRAIWTSPFHTSKENAKWWAIFGGATAVLVATDQWTVKWLPNSSAQVSVSTWGSRVGAVYSLVPISAGFYFIGSGAHNDRFRETGLIGFEALIDATLVVETLKVVSDRARPFQGNGKGRFEDNPDGRWGSGFPSGHAISTWALASVVAHQYPRPLVIPLLAYGLASTVVVARVGARKHFPGDVVAGSAMGWFIGDYIFAKRHNRDLENRASALGRVAAHVHIGGPARPVQLAHREAERSAVLAEMSPTN